MVPFAGYELPVNYPAGIMAEHNWTRENAGLFDVSHMGQALLSGPDAARQLESLLPGDIEALPPRRIRYSQFTNDEGGILDDLMVTKLDAMGDNLFLVVNAACKAGNPRGSRASRPARPQGGASPGAPHRGRLRLELHGPAGFRLAR
jgi:aminomethyltransferase